MLTSSPFHVRARARVVLPNASSSESRLLRSESVVTLRQPSLTTGCGGWMQSCTPTLAADIKPHPNTQRRLRAQTQHKQKTRNHKSRPTVKKVPKRKAGIGQSSQPSSGIRHWLALQCLWCTLTKPARLVLGSSLQRKIARDRIRHHATDVRFLLQCCMSRG